MDLRSFSEGEKNEEKRARLKEKCGTRKNSSKKEKKIFFDAIKTKIFLSLLHSYGC